PVFQPAGRGQLGLHGVFREHGFVHVQVGGVQRLSGSVSRSHQNTNLGESQTSLQAKFLALVHQSTLHVAQVSASMTGLVLSHDLVDGLDHRLGMPVGSTAVPVVQTDRKSTRLNSSHVKISYAVFCLKKKNKKYECLH